MLLVDTVIRKCKICVLVGKIKRHKRLEKRYRAELINRNMKYHNGRLNIDFLVNNLTKNNRKNIFNLKRQIVKER